MCVVLCCLRWKLTCSRKSHFVREMPCITGPWFESSSIVPSSVQQIFDYYRLSIGLFFFSNPRQSMAYRGIPTLTLSTWPSLGKYITVNVWKIIANEVHHSFYHRNASTSWAFGTLVLQVPPCPVSWITRLARRQMEKKSWSFKGFATRVISIRICSNQTGGQHEAIIFFGFCNYWVFFFFYVRCLVSSNRT